MRISLKVRATHAAFVQRELNTAWANAEQQRAVAHSSRSGVYLEFLSEPGFDLAIKQLEAPRSGIKLLNVHVASEDPAGTTRATVFVPHDKSAHFLRKIQDYATSDNRPKADGTTTPKNAPLVESIGGIRAAILESSFWQDAVGRIPGDEPDWVEVWLSSEDLGVIEVFVKLCGDRGVRLGEGRLTFPDRTVVLALASRADLEMLIEHSGSIAEFRAAREVATFYVEMENREQSELVNSLLGRVNIQNIDQIVVLVLDHGVNNGHRLLQPVLPDAHCHTEVGRQ